MKLRAIGVLPSHLVMVGFAVVFVTHLDLYLEAVGQWPVPMLAVHVCAAVVAALTVPTLVHAAGSTSARDREIELLSGNTRVLLALEAVVAASFIAAFSRTAWLDVGPRYVLYPAYTATVIVFSMLLPFPAHRREWFWWYIFAAFVVTVGSILTDVWHPGTFSIIPERAAGFARNPNGGGFLVVALCTTLLSFERVRPLDLFVLVATTGAVVATLSRGAMLLVAFVAVCYAAFVVRHAWRRGIGTVLKVVGGLGLLVGLTVGGTTVLIGQRMFTSPGSRVDMLLGREQAIGPRESRIELLQHSLDLARESPVFGYGSGFTARMPQGPHNMYVSRWLDDGLPGMLSYIGLLVTLALTFWKRRYIPGMVFTAVLVVEGFFSHNIFEERAFLILPGVLLTLSYFASRETVPARAKRGWGPTPVPRPAVRRTAPPTLST
jgi:O-antigen ligase